MIGEFYSRWHCPCQTPFRLDSFRTGSYIVVDGSPAGREAGLFRLPPEGPPEAVAGETVQLSMNAYQREHADTFRMVRGYLSVRSGAERRLLLELCAPYTDFRKRLDDFQRMHVADLCTGKCFRNRLSACCSRDSIVVYFADVVVQCLHADGARADEIESVLGKPNQGHRCVYLTGRGCRWRVSPIVCAMFLCDEAESRLLNGSAPAAGKWRSFQRERRRFTWPDRPVLFDALERRFLDAGLSSPLMHLNSSPGLLAVKRRAGLPGKNRVFERRK